MGCANSKAYNVNITVLVISVITIIAGVILICFTDETVIGQWALSMGITGGLVGTAQKKPVADLPPEVTNAMNTWMATQTPFVPPSVVDISKLIKDKKKKKKQPQSIKLKTITVDPNEDNSDVVDV